MQEFFWNLDLLIFQFFNQTLSYDWLNQATPILTDLDHLTWFKIVAPLAVIFAFYKRFKRAGITYFIFLILALSSSDFIGGKVKKIFLRPRPFQIVETAAVQRAPAKENRSFYSNHTSNMFTTAAFLTVFFPAGRAAFYIVALFIGFTRIHVGVHYPSDVLFGAIAGILLGLLFSLLAKKLVLKINQNEINNS